MEQNFNNSNYNQLKLIMARVIYLLICLFVSICGLSQTKNSSHERNQKVESSQNADYQFYCDNEIAAHFPGGSKAWMKFVGTNFRMTVPINKAPKGTYQVIVVFWITKEGKISDVKAETNVGYGIKEEVIRVIQHSPKWIPATNCGKKIDTAKRQPVTIIVS